MENAGQILHSGSPICMGIVNVTPDSFSDGGKFLDSAAAAEQGRKLAREGAGILDLGAEATSFFRKGVAAVGAREQLQRLLPVVAELKGKSEEGKRKTIISIDTRMAEVARACVAAGAGMINDVSAGEYDAEMLPTVAELGVPVVLMHISPGYPETPAADEADIVGTVVRYLRSRIDAAMAAGLQRENILVDPGIGFGKTMADNWRLVAGVGRILEMGLPVVLGASRKRFLETAVPAGLGLEGSSEWKVGEKLLEHPRDAMTARVTAWAATQGVQVHRVHDVTLAMRALGANAR